MSYTSIAAAVIDPHLIARVRVAIAKEAQNNLTLHETPAGQAVTRFGPDQIILPISWAVAIDYEAEYEYAINSDNPNPGGDAGVISDANIGAAVQAHWPTAV